MYFFTFFFPLFRDFLRETSFEGSDPCIRVSDFWEGRVPFGVCRIVVVHRVHGKCLRGFVYVHLAPPCHFLAHGKEGRLPSAAAEGRLVVAGRACTQSGEFAGSFFRLGRCWQGGDEGEICTNQAMYNRSRLRDVLREEHGGFVRDSKGG